MYRLGVFAVLLSLVCARAEILAGADLSIVPRLEQARVVYFDNGQPREALSIFHDHNYRIVRLRLWHTPAEPWHGLDSVLAFAQRVKNAGFEFLLDLHYSDTWADPAQQTKPAAWQGLTFPVLVDSVYAYTNSVIRRFRDGDALPEYVQIGNEISAGML
jgi:arabinogalactan endo-1,4-beta-galactosidase